MARYQLQNKNGLTVLQMQCLPFFTSGMTIKEAADMAGIDRGLFYSWIKKPEFRKAYDDLNEQIFINSCNQIKQLTEKGVSVLARLLDSDNEKIRLGAVSVLLQSSVSLRDILDMNRRLECLS